MFAASMITGKIVYYHTSAMAYTELIQQNEAQAMKNMAVANELHDKQELKFNIGEAKRSKDKCIVWLNNQKKFEFSIASWKDEDN